MQTDYKKNTLKFYNKKSLSYFDRTASLQVNHLYNFFEKFLPKKGLILDLGAGSGRDSRYFLDQGYSVVSIDGSKNLARLAKEKFGISMEVMDFSEISFVNKFDGVWASSSLLHLRDDDLISVIKKIHTSLKERGFFYASFKYGSKTEIDESGRLFNFKNFQSIISLFDLFCDQFELIAVEKDKEQEQHWIQFMAQKKALLHPA